MNCTIKEVTTKRHHYNSYALEIEAHLNLLVDAYNHTRWLETLEDLTPVPFIWKE